MLALTACGGAASSDTEILHVGSQRGGAKALMLASGALDGASYEVEWSEFPAAQHLLEAIGGGAVDVGLVGDAPFMFAYQSGSRIKAVAAHYVEARPMGALALVVPKSSPVRSLADLKGRKIATTRGSIGHYLVIRALQQAKLPPDWVSFAFLPPGDAKAAFSSGAIDGWSTWAPYLLPAINEGARTIVDGHDLVKGYSFAVASDDAIRSKPALLADYLRREAKALAWARANPDAYGAVLARETGLPIEVARDYAVKNGRTAIPIDDALIAEQRQTLDDFRTAGAVSGNRPLPDGFDRTLFTRKVAAAN
ncbi:aliphatic sulfonate ABC transporter substrate-binding protein [Sphingomonas sp. SRS2]|nr:aliphatic sulfonate ABC transporter substrate-binding protein [Sphingomonas sp. SRS2]